MMDTLEEKVYNSLRKSYEEKLRTLPPPPPGWYYKPEIDNIRREGDRFVVDVALTLDRIVK